MPEDEFAARAGQVIGAEEQASQRVRVNVAFEAHPGSALYVQHEAISIIKGRHDAFRASFPGQLEEAASVEPVEPGQAVAHLVSVNPAARYSHHMICFTGQDGRARELAKIGLGRSRVDFVLPAIGKPTG